MVLVSGLMILVLMIVVVGEGPGQTPPDWYLEDIEAGQDGDGDGNDNVTMVRKEIELFTDEGWTGEGAAAGKSFDIEDEDAIGLIVEVHWVDDVGDNDEMGLSLENESGQLVMDQGTSGSLRIEYEVQEGEALAGEFAYMVHAIDCPGRIGTIPIDMDDGNDWTVTVTLVIEVEEEGSR
jgi:hypothetical protein